ncbi:MAG: response regulator [Verrucomicrobiales bacterium]|nr:response regulator [Verrucomicrobiales bacterium]
MPPPSSSEPGIPGGVLRFLVADDHPVNQFLVRELIEMRGHQACVVADGLAAVKLCTEQRFDVILMDIQMPQLNGIEATQRIRELEQGSGRTTPIVALTANTGPTERDACLKAGINAFLSKPLDPDLLFPLIGRLTGNAVDRPAAAPAPADEHPNCPVPGATETPAAQSPAPRPGFLDREAALRLARGNAKVLSRLAELFRQQTPAVLEGIRSAIERRCPQDLSFHAHRLKGSLSFLAVNELESAALMLEQRGKEGCWDDVPETWSGLQTGLTALDAELETLKP